MDVQEITSRWTHWEVWSESDRITALVNHLDNHLPAGWKRLTDEELSPSLKSLSRGAWGSYWYAIRETSSHPGLKLGLSRPVETFLKAGLVLFDSSKSVAEPPDLNAGWKLVMDFLNEGIVPSARSCAVPIQLPAPEDTFLDELPGEARFRLVHFSRKARKLLPLSQEEAEAWQGFVIEAFRTKAAIDFRFFRDWLAREGWSRESTASLESRFFDETLLLSKYSDELTIV